MTRALAITVSNRASAGIYPDKSGPVLAELLRSAGCETDGPEVIPDGVAVEEALLEAHSRDDPPGHRPGDPRHCRGDQGGRGESGRSERDTFPWGGGAGRDHSHREPAGIDRRRAGRHVGPAMRY